MHAARRCFTGSLGLTQTIYKVIYAHRSNVSWLIVFIYVAVVNLNFCISFLTIKDKNFIATKFNDMLTFNCNLYAKIYFQTLTIQEVNIWYLFRG